MSTSTGRLAGGVAGFAVVVAYAWWATDLAPFTTAATLAVIGAGVAAIAGGQLRRPMRERRPDVAGMVGWLVLFVTLAAWQVGAYVQQPRSAHPTLSSLANTALGGHTPRTLAFVAWLVVGTWLARR